MQSPLAPPIQFGAHAELIGYDVDRIDEALAVTLHWRAQQPLLPPHHVFVHLDDANGQTVAQDDSPPTTADGAAPTGSWLPGEIISTRHTVTMPANQAADDAYMLRVGLYNPDGNIRLPATIAGEPHGDHAEFAIE